MENKNKEPWYLKVGKYLTYWVSSGGWIAVCILAVFGIFCTIVEHYGTLGFNWKWFVFFEFPLYAFCVWAIVKLIILMRKFNKLN